MSLGCPASTVVGEGQVLCQGLLLGEEDEPEAIQPEC